jgi:hypothetical protein
MAIPPAVMAIWSGSDDVATSMSILGLLVLRNMSASAMQLISVGWRDGRIPVVERMESPFFFFLDESSSSSVLFVVSFAERRSMMDDKELLVVANAGD